MLSIISRIIHKRRAPLFVGLLLIALVGLAWWGHFLLVQRLTAIHQRGVLEELKQWAEDYSHIESQSEAVRAAEMLIYIEHYYVPGEGYRSNPETERALEKQRDETTRKICASLAHFTGVDYGSNGKAWLTALHEKDQTADRK